MDVISNSGRKILLETDIYIYIYHSIFTRSIQEAKLSIMPFHFRFIQFRGSKAFLDTIPLQNRGSSIQEGKYSWKSFYFRCSFQEAAHFVMPLQFTCSFQEAEMPWCHFTSAIASRKESTPWCHSSLDAVSWNHFIYSTWCPWSDLVVEQHSGHRN